MEGEEERQGKQNHWFTPQICAATRDGAGQSHRAGTRNSNTLSWQGGRNPSTVASATAFPDTQQGTGSEVERRLDPSQSHMQYTFPKRKYNSL